MRLLTQYNSSDHQVLMNWLASYELVPGTVLHAGYGSLYERGAVNGEPLDRNAPVRLNDKYLATNRGLFFKASYLHRF